MQTFCNENLKEALTAFAQEKNEDNNAKVLAALISGLVLVPTIWDKDPILQDGQYTFEKDTKFQLLTIETTDHRRFFPMFSSLDEWKRWEDGQQGKWLVLGFDQYFPWVKMAQSQVEGIVLDPYGSNVPISTSHLIGLEDHLKSRLQENTIKKGEKIQLRSPQGEIDDLLGVLCQFAKDNSLIRSMTLKERVHENNSHWFLIVDMEKEDPSVFEQMGKACKKVSHGKEFEFIFASMKLAQEVLRDSTPFYVR